MCLEGHTSRILDHTFCQRYSLVIPDNYEWSQLKFAKVALQRGLGYTAAYRP